MFRHRFSLFMPKYFQMRTYLLIIIALFALPGLAQTPEPEFMDRVLVIVNEDVITQSEYNYRLQTVIADLKKQGKEMPTAELQKQLLEGMVGDRLQIQEADRRGIDVTESELDSAMERFAAQQNMNAKQLQDSFAQHGETYSKFRQSVRESILISRLNEYYTHARVVVPDYEIDGFIAQNDMDDGGAEYQIAHILIKNPEQNSALAQRVLNEIRDGLSFQQAAMTYSQAADAQEGGMLGWRRPAQLPEIFSEAIKTIKVNQVTDVLSSANGLHILKLLDMKGDRQEVVQSHVRHILMAADTKVARSQAVKRLQELRQRIIDGENFADLARIYSDDSVSAANGGDLDWASPGDMTPPFERAFNQAAIGEVSQPFESQFGVHILEVLDRREKNITDQIIRGRADNFLRRRRAEREFDQWIRELREQAYIEYVSQPA